MNNNSSLKNLSFLSPIKQQTLIKLNLLIIDKDFKNKHSIMTIRCLCFGGYDSRPIRPNGAEYSKG